MCEQLNQPNKMGYLIDQWIGPSGWRLWAAAASIAAFVTASAALVYFTGGIKFVYAHSMYMAIIMGGIVFGVRGGIITALAGAIALGPVMPVDVATGEIQKTANWIYRMIFFLLVGGVTGLGMTFLRLQLKQIRHLAFHDPHSQLPSRYALNDALTLAFDQQHSFHVVVLTVDNLEDITSSLGYTAASKIIQQGNARLIHELGDDVKIFHYHPDRLAIINDGGDEGDLWMTAESVRRAMAKPFEYEEIPVYVSIHIGGAFASQGENNAQLLIRRADVAVAHAREHGLRYAMYDTDLDANNQANLAMLGQLGPAIEQGQLRLHYQPKVDLVSGTTIGVESLVRWEHPKLGMIPPDQFIPQAEKTDLINNLCHWTMKTALDNLYRWQEMGLAIEVAVNVSARNLRQSNFATQILAMLEQHNIDPQYLEIEITESDIMKNPDQAIALLERLHETKIIISIDDFGTGYSSLAYLKKLPATFIKIDQIFIRHLPQDHGLQEIVKGSIAIAHGLGMKVIAEGIEDQQTIDLLLEMGCDVGQGYHIAKPQDRESIEQFFKNKPWPAELK